MNIAVFGLGYVGCVTAACLARDGHTVVGVDVQPAKVEEIREGRSPLVEPGLSQVIADVVRTGRLQATADGHKAVAGADIVMICVGTPSKESGNVDLTFVERVCTEIGQALRTKDKYTVIVVRSTILPGKAESCLLPVLEANSGKVAGAHFGLCTNPEFLREGSAIRDYENPPFTVIGELDERSGNLVAQLYSHIRAPLFRVNLGAAEMVKYASNAFHALKIVFANEIGNLCQAYDVDSHLVMDVVVSDTKLNISPAYLKPGFAFGGSCLGKDLRALLHAARQKDVSVPMLNAIIPSNQLQIEKAVRTMLSVGRCKVAMLGLSFKENTDDLRESPAVELAEQLIGKGYELRVYDRDIAIRRLSGSNRAHIDRAIPHIASLVSTSLEEAVQDSDVVLVAKKLRPEEEERLYQVLQPTQMLFDLVGLNGQSQAVHGRYHGIAW